MKTTLFVLGGWIIKRNGMWETTPVGVPADNNIPTNDRLRVDAAACYFKKNPQVRIIVSGSPGQLGLKGAPAVASVMKAELLLRGIPEEAIFTDEESGTTWEQLKTLAFKVKSAGLGDMFFVLSNEWHFPRVKALVEYGPEEIKKLLSKVQFLSAEEILLSSGEKWPDIVSYARKVTGLKDRILLEEKGIKALRDGTYKFR